MSKIKELYKKSKSAKVGEECVCPSCGTKFMKTNYQQAFCKTKGGTVCKDKYWNTVIPQKRCNTTRVSPANARFKTMQSDACESQRRGQVEFGVWHDDDWCEADGGSGVSPI